MTQRFETKIKESLLRLKAGCEKKNREVHKVERQIGRLLAKNSRAAKLFDIKVSKAKSGGAIVEWSKVDGSRNWATLSAGCFAGTFQAGQTKNSGILARCVSKPTDHQQILFDKLGLNLPAKINLKPMS